MDSLNRSRSMPRYSRSRTNSNSRLTPNMAAAMLSLRWPPPQADNSDQQKDDSDIDYGRPSASKASSSKKLHKKNSKQDKRNNNRFEEEVTEYLPVTTPEFHEVHTAWPGFDHEPVPNWEEKYMIAKPYPRNATEISNKSSFLNYGNDLSTVSSKDTGLLKSSKSRSRSKVGGTKQKTETATRRKRIIYVERVGSCIK